MQKLLTITINIEKLQEASKGLFHITEVEEINGLLEEGWAIEEWKFVTAEKENSKAVLLVILNDNMADLDFDSAEYGESEYIDDVEDVQTDNGGKWTSQPGGVQDNDALEKGHS